MKREYLKKKEKGAVSVLVLFTVLMFCVILAGVFFMVSTMQKAQLKSDMRIQDLYERDVDKVDSIYEQLQKVEDTNEIVLNDIDR